MTIMARTRAKLALFLAATASVLVFAIACGNGEQRPAPVISRPTNANPTSPEPPAPPPQYVLADPPVRSGSFFSLALGPAAPPGAPPTPAHDRVQGVILDGLRMVAQGASLKTAKDVAEQPLIGAHRLPKRLGGGFLFRTRNALFLSETFDGTLKPLVATASDISELSFGPKSVMLRGDAGERWIVEIPSGKRLPIAPAGLIDVAALDDGRAAALAEMGRTLVSADGGATWSDVTSQLRSRAERLQVEDETLWIVLQNGQAVKVEAGGQLTSFDKAPAVKIPEPLRPKDPRWRTEEPPIRRAMRLGAPIDDQTALVATDGDVVRINVVSGEIVSVAAGRLPPDATCEATRTSDDVVLTCTRPNGLAFVASHTVGDKVPVIEQTFGTQGQFYVSDDGGIAFGGPCARAKPSKSVVCVRAATGGWQEFDLETALADGGGPPVDVVRWVPRADGSAIGIVGGVSWGFIDARTGEVRPWPSDVMQGAQRGAIQQSVLSHRAGTDAARVADRNWSATSAGTVRGWGVGANAGAFEISLDGAVTPSAFSFDRVATAGPFALARARDGRVWQTLDRGVTWVEVQAPITPRVQSAVDVRACSAVGCDLGTWYRLGWPASAPMPFDPPGTAPGAPQIRREAAPQLVCKPTAEPKKQSIPHSERSPEDLGLGMNRLAVSDEKGESEYLRTMHHRLVPNPIRDGEAATEESASRAMVHGHTTTTNENDKLVVQGNVKDLQALRRTAMFVAPFDVSGTVRKSIVAVSDVTAGLRAAGSTAIPEFLKADPTGVSFVVPMTPLDPTVPNDVFFTCDTGMIGAWRASGTARTRLTLASNRLADSKLVSGVALGADDFAVLEIDQNGKGRVARVTASGLVAIFEVPAPPTPQSYPANNDALAIGPKGELAVLRTPSGGEPSSALDPALLLAPGAGVTALAAWSTLTPAEDAACKSDTGGWRATIQTQLAWIRLSGADTNAMEDTPMAARVRWSTTRVCLEAVELRAEDIQMTTTGAPGGGIGPGGRRWQPMPWEGPVENWVVAKFAGGASAGRVGIIPGIEIRQPLTCGLAPP